MVIRHQEATTGIIRTISHDFKEPLRSVRWYLKKLKTSSDIQPVLLQPVDDFDDMVRYIQQDFQKFYNEYKDKRIALLEFRSFVRSTIGRRMHILASSWYRLYTSIDHVKFTDPKLLGYSDISVSSLNETVRRILRRYDGLVRYLDIRGEPVRLTLGLHYEVHRVFNDLKAIMVTEHADYLIRGQLVAKFDQTLVSLIFQNLMVNSIKYKVRQRDPRILIRMGVTTASELIGHVPDEPDIIDLLGTGGQVGFVIYSDNGRGIPDSFADTAFHPFIQVNPADPAGGSGMGLAIVRSAVESHDGRVWLKSRLDVGTTFFMLFPLDSIAEPRLTPATTVHQWFSDEGGLADGAEVSTVRR